MLNYIWAAMIVLGIIFGALNGNMKAVTEAALDSAGEAVSLCISMAGVMALWVGLMEVAESSGLILKLTRMLSPFVSFMFPGLPKGHKARDYISMNIIANILGLGWACTPAGLKAMEELAKLEEERGTPGYVSADGTAKGGVETMDGKKGKQGRVASNEMCTFLILNISSLQLIPVNMIAYRSQYGSVNPAGIIAPAIVATFFSTAVAVVFCRVKDRRRR
ncbi:nucleoside recognition protein [Lachnospiraceae bacterium]|jgi:spore maturation protein A|nr:nucleoside recognition protein [Lachnospiraceae bacterium]